jgi:hypothetical protein
LEALKCNRSVHAKVWRMGTSLVSKTFATYGKC